jgi:hypothetical protein
MERWRSAACGKALRPRSQVPDQMHRSESDCRRGGRRWQRAKRQSDADYRKNQARARRAWVQGHRDHWRAYRRTHRERRAARFAKMDASKALSHISSGTYRLLRRVPQSLQRCTRGSWK